MDAFEKAKPWCSHIHLANCVLRRGDPMYGDKHPLFGIKGGEFGRGDMQEIVEEIRKKYYNEDVIVAIEIIQSQKRGTI